MDTNELRDKYAAKGICETEKDPLNLFAEWFEQARAALPEPTAMVLATSRPSARIMLLKGVVDGGFDFDTHYESQKAGEIESDPHVALLFPWHAIGRQVRIEGEASKLGDDQSTAYFDARPRNSQLCAVATAQSSTISDRAELVRRFAEVEQQFPDAVPRPNVWGGYRVRPTRVEFWQARPGLVHDRLAYRRSSDGWIRERLTP